MNHLPDQNSTNYMNSGEHYQQNCIPLCAYLRNIHFFFAPANQLHRLLTDQFGWRALHTKMTSSHDSRVWDNMDTVAGPGPDAFDGN